mgnify:CR=1 FL=1
MDMAAVLELCALISGYAFFFAVLMISLIMIPIGLPGTWLMALTMVIYSWIDGFTLWKGIVIAILLVLATIGELIEFLAGYKGARQAKGTRRGAVGAIMGGLLGAFIGAFFGLLGAVPGAIVGTFLGALAIEYWITKDSDNSLGVAKAAMIGKILGSIAKTITGMLMLCTILAYLIGKAVS